MCLHFNLILQTTMSVVKALGPLKPCFHSNAWPASRQLRKWWIFLHILSSSPFLECTVGAVLKTCARSEGNHAKGLKRQCVWLAYWVPWSFWECCRWCLHFECILSIMEVTQQNRLSLDCSGEGTEMFASLLIGLRNVGTQRTQHPHAGRQFLFPHAFE